MLTHYTWEGAHPSPPVAAAAPQNSGGGGGGGGGLQLPFLDSPFWRRTALCSWLMAGFSSLALNLVYNLVVLLVNSYSVFCRDMMEFLLMKHDIEVKQDLKDCSITATCSNGPGKDTYKRQMQ